MPPLMNTEKSSSGSTSSQKTGREKPRFQRIYTGTRWETQNGYCRGLRAGNHIFITGTVAVNPDGSPHAPGDGAAQATRCFEIISSALHRLGAGVSDLVRVRLFVTDITQSDAIGRAHAAWVGEHHPCLTMVGVKELVDPAFVIEVEADALVADDSPAPSDS